MFESAPKSYKDPFWKGLAQSVESEVGLPSGLLQNVLLKGERSNADQVSSAGARTPFQIIPQTRKAVQEKYGVDAYSSPENAAKAAALLLKESLDRNQGSVMKAVQEYHGGTNPKNYGPINRDYVKRVLGDMEPQKSRVDELVRMFNERKKGAQPNYGQRADGTQKGSGFLGAIKTPDGQDMTELSVGVDFGQGEMQIPTLVPTLTPQEIETLRTTGQPTDAIVDKAVAFAQQRIQQGLPVFATAQESPQSASEAATTSRADELVRMFNERKAQQQSAATEPTEQPSQFEQTGGEVARQLGLTARAGIEGVAGLAGIVTDPIAAIANQFLPEGSRLSTLQGATSAALTEAGFPTPQNAVERTVQSGAQTLAGGGAGVLAGRAAQAVPGLVRAGGEFMAAGPSQQLTGAAGAGVGQQVATEQGAGALGQTAASIGGALAGGRIAQPRQALDAVPSAANREGISVMTSDVVQPQTFMGKSARMLGERIPIFGTGGSRAAQETQRIQAVKRLASDYGADVDTPFDTKIAQDLVKTRGDTIQRYTKMKGDVFTKLEPLGEVPLPRALAKIDEEIANLEKLGEAVPRQAVQSLRDFRSSFEGQNIQNVEQLRKLLGDTLSDPSLAGSKSILEKIPNRVYGELRKDMADFIGKNGDKRDLTKWELANRRLSELAGEVQSRKFKSVLNDSSMSPEAVNRLLFSVQKSDVKRLMENLSPKGRENAKAALIKRAYDQSVKMGSEGQPSTVKFASELEKLADNAGVVFNKAELDRIKGLQEVLDLTRRASDAKVLTPTGQEAFAPAAALGVGTFFSDLGTAFATAASVGAVARIYESPAIRNLLIKIGRAKGTEKERLIENLKRQTLPVALNQQDK